MAQPSRDRTLAAFTTFRNVVGIPRSPKAGSIHNAEECIQMSAADGMVRLVDGHIPANSPHGGAPRSIEAVALGGLRLWVVSSEDVVYADEHCQFGRDLPNGKIKHTNLTGGAAAYAGGEMICADGVLVVNGFSGRYAPRSPAEMQAVAVAFAESGYHVWSMGYDVDADFPYPFLGVLPELVS